MKFRVIRKEQQIESNWSGGKTWELAIFPEGARYLDRDFLWRLSTASSDLEESSFTKLPDYDRILMVLEGDVVLAHAQERTAHLAALEQDSFDGAVKTRCFGKLLRDYNLIMRKGCTGSMEVRDVRSAAVPVPMSSWAVECCVSYGVFCLEGYTVVSCGEESEMLHPGEQAVVDFPDGVTEDVKVMGEGRCILTEVVMPGIAEAAKAEQAGSEAGTGDAAGGSGTGDAAGGSGVSGEKKGPGEGSAAGSSGGSGASQAGGSGGNRASQAGGSSDYLTCLKLFVTRNRWSMAFRQAGGSKTYYDRPLVEALRKIERWYITEAIWIIGALLCFVPMSRGVDGWICVAAAAAFTLVHIFGIVPAIYLKMLPRPLHKHIKKVADLNAAEKAYHEEEISENPRLEKLMRKYKSDDDSYFADESSPLYRLVKKK